MVFGFSFFIFHFFQFLFFFSSNFFLGYYCVVGLGLGPRKESDR